MITISFNNTDKILIEKFVRMGDKLVGDVAFAMAKEMRNLSNYVKSAKLSGQVLHNRTGNLRRSVFPFSYMESRTAVVGKVAVGSEAPYGKIHEFGGSFVARRNLKRPSHLVTRRGGERVMTGSPFGIHFPARPFMHTSLQERRMVIMAGLRNAVNKSVIG
jgi:phage gpG-like protein